MHRFRPKSIHIRVRRRALKNVDEFRGREAFYKNPPSPNVQPARAFKTFHMDCLEGVILLGNASTDKTLKQLHLYPRQPNRHRQRFAYAGVWSRLGAAAPDADRPYGVSKGMGPNARTAGACPQLAAFAAAKGLKPGRFPIPLCSERITGLLPMDHFGTRPSGDSTCAWACTAEALIRPT